MHMCMRVGVGAEGENIQADSLLSTELDAKAYDIMTWAETESDAQMNEPPVSQGLYLITIFWLFSHRNRFKETKLFELMPFNCSLIKLHKFNPLEYFECTT